MRETGGRAIKECVAQLFHCWLDLLGKVVTYHEIFWHQRHTLEGLAVTEKPYQPALDIEYAREVSDVHSR